MQSMKNSVVRQYRLDFTDDASASERGKVSARLDKMGVISSDSVQTKRSGPFGLEYSHQIEYIVVTTLDNLEDAIFKRAVETESCFSICTLTRIR